MLLKPCYTHPLGKLSHVFKLVGSRLWNKQGPFCQTLHIESIVQNSLTMKKKTSLLEQLKDKPLPAQVTIVYSVV